jgi:protein SCO1/2
LQAAVGAIAVVLALTACGGSDAPTYGGLVREPPPLVDVDPVPDATDGEKPMRLRAKPGGLLLVYFGYTFCPDVCPTTMADLRTAIGGLEDGDADRVEVAMITVDPDRDTGEALARYVHAFIPDGHAISTADEELLGSVAERFGAGYEVTTGAGGEIEVSHTAYVYAVDEQGKLVLQWPFRTPPDALRDDLESLLDAAAGAS